MTFLDKAVAQRRRDVIERKRDVPLGALRASAVARSPVRDFAAALRECRARPAIIAEFKRASPSAGAISSADIRDVARAYERGGATAMSVLTESHWFAGDLADVTLARSACMLPVLRKDFIVDEYQVWESAAAGADALLLIVAALEDDALRVLRALTEGLGMLALVEVHDEAEVRRAVAAGAQVIGVNNRDLHTLAVDTGTAVRIRQSIPHSCLSIAESGYRDPADIAGCAVAGFDAVLVGESLLRAADSIDTLRALRGAPI